MPLTVTNENAAGNSRDREREQGMTTHNVALIHTVTSLPDAFRPLCEELLPPDTEVTNIVDESLLRGARLAGRVTPLIRRRLATHVWGAIDMGVQAALVTCSSMGEIVDLLAPFSDIPVVRVDVAMVQEALRLADRIGVAATLATTLEPTAALLRREAEELGKEAKIVSHVCDGAFDAGVAGDRSKHDRLVSEAVQSMAAEVDVVILAQASMARALDGHPIPVPVLSSPRLAVARLAQVLAG